MKKYINVDGNTATSNIAYYFSEVAAIYPITPSSTMAELADEWSQTGKTNLFDMPVQVEEMQSEAGAAGAVHGSLIAGALTTTFTASQGLLLMIPNMLKIAGELLPAVFHVSARAVATHALSIFGDHSDVMQCRATGFCMLASSSVQQAQDMAVVAHIAALKSSLPFLHFFDGFRTSHEVQKIEAIDESILKELTPFDEIQNFKKRCLNPSHPSQAGTAQNPDVFFQNREACNKYYDKVYYIVCKTMEDLSQKTGRTYHPFDYFGDKNAENVIVVMGSGAETIEEALEHTTNIGLVNVRLYRPFNIDAFVSTLPKNVKRITVLDRTKESGSPYEPLALDVISALSQKNIKAEVLAGRYGLGGKEFDPACVKAIIDNMLSKNPKIHFTVGIEDDVTNLSLPINMDYELPTCAKQLKFYGLGGDGTVSANKNSIKIIGENTNKYTQGYFEYDSKKSGSLTISHLRISDNPIKSTYTISKADFIAIHNFNFVARYDILKDLKKGGVVLLNTTCSENELDTCLPMNFKKDLKAKNANLYIINAQKIAEEIGLGNKINTIMQSAFFKISNVIDFEQAKQYMKKYAEKTYGKKGEQVVKTNFLAIDKGSENLIRVDLNNLSETTGSSYDKQTDDRYFREYIEPINRLQGNNLPVSKFSVDGKVPTDTTKFEKRGIASRLPCWQSENCIQCGMCVAVCPHSALKSAILSPANLENKPTSFATANAMGCVGKQFKLQVSPLDCTGCGVCANTCPAKQKAIIMKHTSEILDDEKQNFDYFENLEKENSPFDKNSTKGLQFEKSYFEYNYACAGCGETPYIKLASQLFGENMIIANATGCSSIYGGSSPACPYSKNCKGYGPAWANSLFEDNAEFGAGISFAVQSNKQRLLHLVNLYLPNTSGELKELLTEWCQTKQCSNDVAEKIVSLLQGQPKDELQQQIIALSDFLAKKSIWIIGGDGWAYDIGYGGLDQVLNSKQNVNILVLDTEVYSNTGGQSSKSTPRGSFAKFAFGGKQTKKKDLGIIAIAGKNCYVASIGLGANIQQSITAFKEAEEFDGPSLILAYSPCVNHGFNMEQSQQEIKRAVASGYWNLYRYNPTTDQFKLDSPKPSMSYEEFLLGETRYSALLKKDQQKAKELFELATQDAIKRHEQLEKMANQNS